MRIGIIGAGHAGVEAARRAHDGGADVVLFSNEAVLPYYRPRIVALAFGRVEPEAICLRPERWYRDNGIDLRLDSPVTEIDLSDMGVTAGGLRERFDALIVAVGAVPVILPFAEALPADVLPLWDARGALAIRDRLGTARDLLILGGGISGVEAAVYARGAGLHVTIVEKAGRLMSQQLGERAAAVLAKRLESQGVTLMANRSVTSISKGAGRLTAALDDGQEMPCDLVMTTVGATRQVALFEKAGLKTDRGVLVDDPLQTSAPRVFACGDIAQRDGIRTASVIRATQQGRLAGANAAAELAGRPLEQAADPLVPLSFKHEDIELYAVGPSAAEGLEERVLSDDGQGLYRAVLLEKGVLRGIQMVGSHAEFQRAVGALGRPWPPTP